MDSADFVLAQLPPSAARVLEVGCGSGALARALDAAGHRVLAIDPVAPDGPIFRRVTLEALDELGIDARDHVPRRLDDELVGWADVVVATCDDACPVVPGKRYVSWQLPDPKDRSIDEVRAIRDEIRERVAQLVGELSSSPT